MYKKILEGHREGTLSLSRLMFALWFLVCILIALVSTYELFWDKCGLPVEIDKFYDFIIFMTGIMAGNYVGREGTKMFGNGNNNYRKTKPVISNEKEDEYT